MIDKEKYQKVIQDCLAGLEQLEPDGKNCNICGDGDHQAWECCHNPVNKINEAENKRLQYRCWHCGFVTSNHKEALDHFGTNQEGQPKCYLLALKLLKDTIKKKRNAIWVAGEALHAEAIKLILKANGA